MDISSSLYMLAAMYLVFLMLGCVFYRQTVRMNALKWSFANKTLKVARFVMYIVLLPAGLTCALAVYLVYAEYAGIL